MTEPSGVVLMNVCNAAAALQTFINTTPDGSDGWMDSVRANGDAEFRGTSLIMFGAFVLLAGAGFSARARRAGIALTKENMQAVGEGLSAGLGGDPAARLERLESLRRNGTVTDEEYRRKRAEIVAQL